MLERVGLADRAGDRFGRYSLGMKQRLGIAAALLADPSLLILDEPTNGLDPAGIVEMRSLIRSLADEGMTLFVSSHLLSEIEHICDHVVMIRNGQSVFQGSVADLRGMRTAELVLRPEDPNQLGLLAQLILEKGLRAEIEEETRSVVVADGSSMAGELNRVAFESGVTHQLLGRTRAESGGGVLCAHRHPLGRCRGSRRLGGDPMIVAAFRSEWVKLRRPNLLVGSYVGLALAASLFADTPVRAGFIHRQWWRSPQPDPAGPTQRTDTRREPGRRASRHRGLWDRCDPDRQ